MGNGADSSGGASYASGVLSFLGGIHTNRRLSREARLDRDFQREMSNTAYQRAMADMRKAGLNPLLVGKLGGASTPSGRGVSGFQNPVEKAFQSAYQVAQLKQANNQSNLLKSQSNLTDAQEKTEKMRKVVEFNKSLQFMFSAKKMNEEIEKLKLDNKNMRRNLAYGEKHGLSQWQIQYTGLNQASSQMVGAINDMLKHISNKSWVQDIATHVDLDPVKIFNKLDPKHEFWQLPRNKKRTALQKMIKLQVNRPNMSMKELQNKSIQLFKELFGTFKTPKQDPFNPKTYR